MARINIDEKWKTDPRRTRLVKHFGGNGRLADGMLIEITWLVLAHKGEPIPLKEFKFVEDYQAYIECGMAELRGDLVHVTGSDRYADFFRKQSENGSKPKQAKRSQRKPKETKANLTQPTKPSSSSSISSSPSSSDSGSPSDSSLVTTDPASGAGPKELNSAIWESYRQAYFARYNVDPVRNAKVNAQVAQLGGRLGVEAPHVVAFYLTSNKTFYAAKVHELGLCLADAESLRTQWAKGKALTNADLKRFEKSVESNELDRLISEGKI